MSKRARRKAQRPGEILAAAFEAFSERGFAATRLEEVAAHAGVTKGTIYVYFETKEKLFEEMVRHYSRGILVDADAILAATEGSCAKKLRAFLSFFYGRCVHDRAGRETLRFIVAESAQFPSLVEYHYHNVIERSFILINNIIQFGIYSGEFSSKLGKEDAILLISPILSLAVLKIMCVDGLHIDENVYLSTHIEAMLNGLRSHSV